MSPCDSKNDLELSGVSLPINKNWLQCPVQLVIKLIPVATEYIKIQKE